MTYSENDLDLSDDVSVRQLLGPLMKMKDDGITEIVINEPCAVFVENKYKWEYRQLPELDYARLHSIAQAVATYTDQDFSVTNPILSAKLPGGERLQIVAPPAVERRLMSLTIRVPSSATRTHNEYRDQGMFEKIVRAKREVSRADAAMVELLNNHRYMEFMEMAVRHRKNIAIVGDTGSGKTTYMKTLCGLIAPEERIITIEDTRELFLPHANKVHLLYSTQGVAKVDPTALMKSCMRMKPDRVLPAELRGAEAFDFVDLLTTGHNGSITSFHAESAEIAFERFALMCKKHPHANTYTHAELMRLLHLTVDVIAHVARDGDRRFFTEIYFDPAKKLGLSS